MSKIRIGASEHTFCDASESWIIQQVHERQKDGQHVCVTVILKSGSVDMVLATPQCPRGHGGGRHPNKKEEEIFAIWASEHLNEANWTAGNLVAFVKRAQRLVC